jgi:hypothetical protein
MNSVMDDSRLLTLPSNERIRLLPHMKARTAWQQREGCARIIAPPWPVKKRQSFNHTTHLLATPPAPRPPLRRRPPR